MKLQINNLSPIDDWEKMITKKLTERPQYELAATYFSFTRVAQQFLGVYTDDSTMQQYLYSLKELPIQWHLLFDDLPKTIKASTRTEVMNLLQVHKQTPLSVNRMLAFLVKGEAMPHIDKNFEQHFIDTLKQWLQALDEKHPRFSHPNIQRILMDFVKWSAYYFGQFTKSIQFNEQFPKVLWFGHAKESEVYFLYFLYLFGCDVLVYVPDGKNIFTQYGFEFPTTELPIKGGDFTFPHEKPLKIETLTVRTEELYKQTIYDNSRLNFPWKYLNYETQARFLTTTYEELFILAHSRMELREGFDSEGQKVYLPVLFSKIDGVSAQLEDYEQKLQQLNDHPLSYLINQLPLVAPQQSNYQFYIAEATVNGELSEQKMIQWMIWPYKQLSIPMQLNMARTIIRMIDRKMIQLLPGETQLAYMNVIIATTLKINEEILKLYLQYDVSYDNPKYVVFLEQQQLQRTDAILMTYLAMLGFDVFLYNPNSTANIEHFIETPIYMTHRLEKVDFTLRMDQLLTQERPQEENVSLIDRLFNKLRPKS